MTPANPLLALRAIFFSFVSAVVLLGLVALVVTSGREQRNAGLAIGVVAAWTLLSQVLARVAPRPLQCADASGLLEAYRIRFFLRLAFSESSALAGFVAAIITGSSWPFLVGAIGTAVGFAQAAPTTGNLTRDDETLRAQGCGQSVLAALQGEASP